MAREQVIKEFDGKKFRINEVPPEDARRIMLRWAASLEKDDNGKENQELFHLIMKSIEVEISPDRWIKLDSAELINQHTRARFINNLTEEALSLTLGFYKDGESLSS